MKKTIMASLALLLSSSAAHAAWIKPTPELVCTLDVNAWGKSSSCACPEGAPYNEKIGLCLTGDKYPIMISGSIRSAEADTKGVFIETEVETFQLIVKTTELNRLKRVNGLYFEVEGEFLLQNRKPVIIVDHLRWLD